uniref:Tektin n=1 Tax=Geotrypetes seraphini TaxID=260995 RepID=A0A6P8NHQ7_GEOSA|nr:tektin-4 [Geotrypetes seraphini]
MATEVLLTQQPTPQTIPMGAMPPKEHEVAYNTGQHSSSGLTTAGFRTAKYLTEEWHQNNYARYFEAFADRDQSERVRHEAKKLADETEALAQRTQAESTRKLGERLQDFHFWRSELRREIDDVTAETDLLLMQKRRLERALDATEVPFTLASDNLQCRERRLGPDLVRDVVEVELLKELELIKNVQELLKRTLQQAVDQVRANRDVKQTLEMDWSDKREAYEIDDKCGRLNNQSTDIQFHHNSSRLADFASTPETWAQFTQDNIQRAERERLASTNLRTLIDNIIQDTSEDMRLQCAAVNKAFAKRCEEVDDAKKKLESHLRKVLEEIGDQENNIEALRQAIKDKETALKVAQTRLYHRSYRPHIELCKDSPQFRLISEVEEILASIEALKRKLEEAEQSLKNLEDTRMSLEKEIAVKTNSLFIDREKCMTHRTRYPTIMKLLGYD